MSLTIEAAVKAELEQGNFGIPFFNNEAPLRMPNGEPLPIRYGVIHGLDTFAERTGDGNAKRSRQLLQVDIYEESGNVDPTLSKRIFRHLIKARLTSAPEYVFRLQDLSMAPVTDPTDPGVVRHTISATARRKTS